jgi:glycosyltransferase involved in cell wall biosynthesis
VKVVHVIAELGSGGAETVVAELALASRRRHDEVWVASNGGRHESGLSAVGVRLVRMPLHHRSVGGALKAAAALLPLRRVRPDVVHAHNVGAAVAAHAGLRAPLRTPPLLATFHGVADADYPRAASLLAKVADLVVVVDDSIGGRLTGAGFPEDRLRVVVNAVTRPPRHDRAEVRRSLGIPDGVPVVLSVARLVEQKRPDVLVEAFARVPEPAVLLLAGTGPLRDSVERWVHAAGLTGRVRLLGDRDDVDRLLAAADVLALSSDWEGLPMALLEAMSAGVPVVATAVDGVVRACADAGVLVPRRDPAALGTALRDLVADPARRAALAEAGRARVAAHYSPAALAAGYYALYDEVRAAPRRTR